MDYEWPSRLRRALNPEIQLLQQMIDAHTDRYFRFGDFSDLQHADVLRKKLTDFKKEILRAEEIQSKQSEQKPHS